MQDGLTWNFRKEWSGRVTRLGYYLKVEQVDERYHGLFERRWQYELRVRVGNRSFEVKGKFTRG